MTLEQRLDSFRNLEPDWDSYGGVPPNRTAINNALKSLSTINPDGVLPSNGGVSLYWTSSIGQGDIEFYNDGTSLGCVILYDMGVKLVYSDEIGIDKAAETIRNVLCL